MDTRAYTDKGWKYSELMTWIPIEVRDHILGVLGEQNFVLLSQDEKEDQRMWKAKFLISPEGVEILNLYFIPPAGHA